MSYRDTKIGPLLKIAPREAVRQLLAMLRQTGGNMRAAAELAKVDYKTMKRWCAAATERDPKFDAKVRQLRVEGLADDDRERLDNRRAARRRAKAAVGESETPAPTPG